MAETIIGATGVLIVATRGPDGPGEVSLRLRGATESYLARSAAALPRGTEVVVVDTLGARTVEVESLAGMDATGRTSDPLLEL